MTVAEPSMPVLAAATPRSSTTASIWARTSVGGRTRESWTPRVFWAVTPVIAQVPQTPKASKVLRSACMPAPPPESEPAMVSATLGRSFTMSLPAGAASGPVGPSRRVTGADARQLAMIRLIHYLHPQGERRQKDR